MKRILAFLSLFTSTSTLLCCALPALLVTLGLGASFAGIVGNIPQIIWLSEHKVWLFSTGALLLFVSGIFQWRAAQMSCPADSILAAACTSTRDWSKIIYLASIGIYLVGAFFAFVAPVVF